MNYSIYYVEKMLILQIKQGSENVSLVLFAEVIHLITYVRMMSHTGFEPVTL